MTRSARVASSDADPEEEKKAEEGKFYLLLVTNYANQHQDIKATDNGGTGELLETRPGDEAVPGAFRVYNLLVNLHLARFADPTVRWLFFLFGVGGTAMVATGMLLWVSKRTQQLRGKAPGAALRLVNGLNIASLTGLLGALAAYFAANRLLPVELAARESWEIRVFFLTWLLALGHALCACGAAGRQGLRRSALEDGAFWVSCWNRARFRAVAQVHQCQLSNELLAL